MIIKRELPEKGELVLIKINKIMPHGAYCELTEYKLDAYLPISEIAPGWIKNIHEFIKEGQKAVAKAIMVDPEKKTIDISLKKTSSKERADKLNNANLEKRAERLFDQALEAANAQDKREEILKEIAKKTDTFNDLVNEVVADKGFLNFLKNKAARESIADIISKNVKPPRYKVSYILDIKTVDTHNSIQTIKKALVEVESAGISVLYLGAPRYKITSEDSSYPKAESRIKEAQKILEGYSKQFTYNIKSDKP